MNYITIDNLRMHAFHGVLPQERVVGNDYLISLRVGYPMEKAMETDSLADTMNYAELAKVVSEEMNVQSSLLEHVAGRILKSIVSKFPLTQHIVLSLKKIAPPMSFDMDSAGVEVEWKCK